MQEQQEGREQVGERRSQSNPNKLAGLRECHAASTPRLGRGIGLLPRHQCGSRDREASHSLLLEEPEGGVSGMITAGNLHFGLRLRGDDVEGTKNILCCQYQFNQCVEGLGARRAGIEKNYKVMVH